MAARTPGLSALVSLPSKPEVAALFDACFRHRHNLAMVRTSALSEAGLGPAEITEVRCRVVLRCGGLCTLACAPPHPPPSPIARALSPPLQLVRAVSNLCHDALYHAPYGSAEEFDEIVPAGTDARLLPMIRSVVVKRLPLWRTVSTRQMVSLPRLLDVDWRVDVKTASGHMSNLAIPTALVDLKVQAQPTTSGMMPKTQVVSFEMSRETVSTMLEGLHKIRDTLGAMD